MVILLNLLLFLFLIDVKADDFGVILALINSKPQLEHFPLIMALPVATLTYTAFATRTFTLQRVQYVSLCITLSVGMS
jgi:hypothetical protein